jgi:hypothetical protein
MGIDQFPPGFHNFPPGGTTAPPGVSMSLIPAGSGTLLLRVVDQQLKINTLSPLPLPATIFIPAGNADGVVLSSLSALRISGDVFNSAHDMQIDVRSVGGRISGSIRDLGLPDTTTPAVSSVKAQVDPANQMIVNWNKAMISIDGTATGLSVDRSVGGALSITGLAAGNGTSQWTLNLSGSVTPLTDVISLSTAGANIVDYFNTVLEASTTSVHVPATLADLANCMLYWHAASSEVTPPSITNGTGVTALIDRSPLASPILPGAHNPTWIADTGSGTPGVSFVNGGAGLEQYFKITNSPVDDTVNHCVIALFDAQTEHSTWNGIWTNDAADSSGAELFTISGQAQLNVNSHTGPGPAVTYNAWHLAIVYRTGTTWSVSLDGSVTSTDMTTNQPTGTKSFYIGAFAFNDSFLEASNMKLKAFAALQHSPSSTERTFIRNALHALFPSDTP